MTIAEWAHQWRVSQAAIDDLRHRLVLDATPDSLSDSTPEAVVTKMVRLEAAEMGSVLWRNNVGMATDDHGNKIRYGLANDSVQMNRKTKSSDLIGIQRVRITQPMVGTVLGQFVAREVKRANWTYRGTKREAAQAHFLELVLLMGGDAAFASSTGSLTTHTEQ